MRIVVDTNVIASAIFFGGNPRELLRKCFSDEFEIVCTEDIFNEYIATIEKLTERYKKGSGTEIIPILAENLVFIQNTFYEQYSRDPDDDKFINCARSGKIFYLVSGDKDLLVLNKVEGVKIITVSDFLKEYKWKR